MVFTLTDENGVWYLTYGIGVVQELFLPWCFEPDFEPDPDAAGHPELLRHVCPRKGRFLQGCLVVARVGNSFQSRRPPTTCFFMKRIEQCAS